MYIYIKCKLNSWWWCEIESLMYRTNEICCISIEMDTVFPKWVIWFGRIPSPLATWYITWEEHTYRTHIHVYMQKEDVRKMHIPVHKSAHTALAVKACLLGGNSNTKCSITFVKIALATSALAGGGGPKTISYRDRDFYTESRGWWYFWDFSTIFGSLSSRGYGHGILGPFKSFW